MQPLVTPLDVRPATGLLKALADDNRLRIVSLLARGELCVCHIASALELSQPNVSQHLVVLKSAGVVEGERRGSWIYYRLLGEQDPVRARILRAVLDGCADLEAATDDRRRLAATKGGVSCE
ncbi:MAG: metalloregulator ArsR/SmtB family transcription factor [Pseudomonadota bacterium]|nr:metalloregulator ArsR/SmtB family transcription factor [Pseudomonadota bacterium]